jgi:DNA-binding transcriptional LysR family regulator
MKYTLHQLQIFKCLVETRSITQTAQVLNLTQPAISIQLRNLQNQFDLNLYEILGKQIFITEFGKKIAESADEIIKQVESINYISSRFKGQLASKLRISVVSTGKYVIPFFLKGFLDQHPSVELVLDVTNKAKVLDALESNEADFAMVSILPSKLKVESIPLLKNKLVLVANERFVIPEEGVRLPQLEHLPVILREKGSGTRETMERFFQRNEIQLRKPLVLTSNEAVKQAILADLGISIMPLFGIKNELELRQLKIIPCKGLPIETQWSIIWKKGKSLNPTGVAFLQFLESHKVEILQNHFSWM